LISRRDGEDIDQRRKPISRLGDVHTMTCGGGASHHLLARPRVDVGVFRE
jgi:hypothetical protein